MESDAPDTEALKRLDILAPWSKEASAILIDNGDSSNSWIKVATETGFEYASLRHPNVFCRSQNNESMNVDPASHALRMLYSPERWKNHGNPCLSFLGEFFKHHKSDSTSILIETLGNLGREDVVSLIQSHESSTNATPKDSAAPIFISYQWDYQNGAQTLKYSLEKSGFRCWMDIGEIDGEEREPLQQVIHRALKDSQIVILCYNEKYAESQNCSTEIKLAQEWKKPIIPLLMEQTTFPPDKKDLGFLSNYSTLIFFQKNNDQSHNGASWPAKSYENLLKRLRQGLRQSGSRPGTAAVSKSTAFHIVISSSPDKYFEMQNLVKRLKAYGYNCKAMKISEGSLSSIECDVIIAGLSLRYMKSSVAANEIILLSKIGRPIIPLLLDNIEYPPPGQTKPVFSRLEPVDCFQMPIRSRDHWNTDETEEILDRLESLIPTVHPIRLPRREKSNIPLAKDHVKSLAQPVPQDPLAREASEIRIQIRPPTPDKDGGSHIPVPKQRSRSNSLPAGDSPVEDESDQEEEEDYPSTDSEVRTAKEMQRSHKLPQLENGRNQAVSNSKPSYVRQPQPKRPTYGRGPPAPKPTTVNSVPQQKPKQRRQNFYNPDGPKLPSVYRKKFAVH